MSPLSMLLVCLVATPILMVASQTAEGQHCNKLHAVFTFGKVYYFIYGDNLVLGVDFNGNAIYSGHVAHDIGYDKDVTAAVGIPDKGIFDLISGKHEQGFYNLKEESPFKHKEWSTAEEEFAKSLTYKGIDAAFMNGRQNIMYFAGCEYVEIDPYLMQFVQKGRMDDLGLPCDVDAAWNYSGSNWGLVSMGDKVYAFNSDTNHVEGTPLNLMAIFPILVSVDICKF